MPTLNEIYVYTMHAMF